MIFHSIWQRSPFPGSQVGPTLRISVGSAQATDLSGGKRIWVCSKPHVPALAVLARPFRCKPVTSRDLVEVPLYHAQCNGCVAGQLLLQHPGCKAAPAPASQAPHLLPQERWACLLLQYFTRRHQAADFPFLHVPRPPILELRISDSEPTMGPAT